MWQFKKDEVADLLAKCHRRCCICHRFCGVKIETDHMKPSSEGGADNIDNAIPVCFECHAEIHCYNNDHPRGRKFTEQELRKHKDQWLNICDKNPEIFAQSSYNSDVGPLSSLVDELEYNLKACDCLGSSLSVSQFSETLKRGAISFLEPDLKNTIYTAYAEINHLSQLFYSFVNQNVKEHIWGQKEKDAREAIPKTRDATQKAYEALLKFLQKDTDH